MTAAPLPQEKKAGPIWLFAALSFIPALGFFIGAITLICGLLSSRRGALWAGLLGGAGALLNMAAIIIIGVTFGGDGGEVRRSLAQSHLTKVVISLERFHQETGEYPVDLTELRRQQGLRHPVSILDDGRGGFNVLHHFIYHRAGDGATYDLFSVGPDGKEGTADDIRPVLSDSLVRKSGYRRE